MVWPASHSNCKESQKPKRTFHYTWTHVVSNRIESTKKNIRIPMLSKMIYGLWPWIKRWWSSILDNVCMMFVCLCYLRCNRIIWKSGKKKIKIRMSTTLNESQTQMNWKNNKLVILKSKIFFLLWKQKRKISRYDDDGDGDHIIIIRADEQINLIIIISIIMPYTLDMILY